MQRPSRGPFALLGTAAALGVGVRAIKKARPFQAYNALNPLNSMVLPASLASFELAAESTYSNCPNCKPQFWDNLPIKELVICGIFFVGVVLSGQAAVAANIGYARIICFTFAVGSATFTAASKLFGIEKNHNFRPKNRSRNRNVRPKNRSPRDEASRIQGRCQPGEGRSQPGEGRSLPGESQSQPGESRPSPG
ncbi:hypothetical protein KSW81_002096 [Nannochloris sp. 'desiccata']|nr:hypothetical protein KSW81_002096 [Chlorella desiccata (nom. nud.)]